MNDVLITQINVMFIIKLLIKYNSHQQHYLVLTDSNTLKFHSYFKGIILISCIFLLMEYSYTTKVIYLKVFVKKKNPHFAELISYIINQNIIYIELYKIISSIILFLDLIILNNLFLCIN